MKMTLRNSGLLLLVAIVFVSGGAIAQEKKSEKSLLWKISGTGLKQPSYLFGTYHLLGDKFLAEVPEVQEPFAKAKGIVVELVLDSTKMMNVMMQRAVMQDNKLSSLLSPADFHLVDSVLQALSGYQLTMFDMFKPAQVAMMLGLFQSQKENAALLEKYSGKALDFHFANEGKKKSKTVTPLETMEEQFDMLYNTFPIEEQAKQLVSYAKQSTVAARYTKEMVTLYLAKDIQGLQTLIDSVPQELTGNTDAMFKDRNVKWAKVLPGLMASGSQFIAVGAGHLPGENGVISLLQKQGYSVTPVTK
jgi:uncharacterized protein